MAIKKENKIEDKVTENAENTQASETTINKDIEADEIINKHMLIALGFGVIPVPIVDIIGLTATQISMLKNLSTLYGQTFSEEWAKKSIIALIGGGLALPAAMGLASIIKTIPLLGQTAGVIALGTTGAASTYAIGRVFVKHFESGGDFLSFNSKEAKENFDEELAEGKEKATTLNKDTKAA